MMTAWHRDEEVLAEAVRLHHEYLRNQVPDKGRDMEHEYTSEGEIARRFREDPYACARYVIAAAAEYIRQGHYGAAEATLERFEGLVSCNE